MTFRELHNQDSPLLICNVWDVASARMAEKCGYSAIGTSSAAMATQLGFEDGEAMPFTQLYNVVKRIALNTKLPLTVDIEAGYSRDPSVVYDHIVSLGKLGVSGINIEDSLCDPERKLLDAAAFSELVSYLKAKLVESEQDIFINVRTDTYLLGLDHALKETTQRIKLYSAAGADGIFIPCLTESEDIKTLVGISNLPINLMCMPDLPDFNQLKEIGIKRISMGNFLFDSMIADLGDRLSKVVSDNSFRNVFAS
ncbi:MAG: isocitrate lyase/phosphoenolpyruvate mutase family protein [Alphaproteobacteria bacterium]|nr:isocitrate lyase/phosphoenolpyruvate mutase family protein [Alphaproteobacteria bacterium]